MSSFPPNPRITIPMQAYRQDHSRILLYNSQQLEPNLQEHRSSF